MTTHAPSAADAVGLPRPASSHGAAGGQQRRTPETTYYVYDAGGQRVRKVTERQAAAGQTPTRKKERIYLGGFEIYREYQNDGDTVTLERETLHVMDDKQRIALVETRRRATTRSPAVNSSATSSAITSAPPAWSWTIGRRSFPTRSITPTAARRIRRWRSQTETPKRYRYTGMERDEETWAELSRGAVLRAVAGKVGKL